MARRIKERLTVRVRIEKGDELLHESARTLSAGATSTDVTNAISDCTQMVQLHYRAGFRVTVLDEEGESMPDLRETMRAPNVATTREAFIAALEGKLGRVDPLTVHDVDCDMGVDCTCHVAARAQLDSEIEAVFAEPLDLCTRCGGEGRYQGPLPRMIVCYLCHGEGTVPRG